MCGFSQLSVLQPWLVFGGKWFTLVALRCDAVDEHDDVSPP